MRRRRWLWIVIGALVLVFGYPAWLGYQIWDQSHQDEVHSADAIVVLGAAQYDGRPSAVLKARLDHAIYLYNEDLSDTIFVTGGKQAGDRFTEAAAAESYLVEQQIPATAIIQEPEGSSTLESLEGVADIAEEEGIDSVLLVSDPLHSERVKRMADDLGFDGSWVSWASYEDLNRSRATKVRELVREVAALIAYEWFDR